MKKYIYFAILIGVFSAFQAVAQKNLIVNGGFEDGANGWNTGNAKVTSLDQKSGKASLAIISYVKGKWEGIDQKVKLPKNTQAIEVAGSYKLDEVEQGANAWNAAVFILEFTNGDNKLGEGISIVEKTGNVNWTAFKKSLRVPDGATGFKIMIALSETSGTFFLDDVSTKVITIEDFNQAVKTN